MNSKLVPLAAIAVLAVVVIWQEVRIRGLERAARPADGAVAIAGVAELASDFRPAERRGDRRFEAAEMDAAFGGPAERPGPRRPRRAGSEPGAVAVVDAPAGRAALPSQSPEDGAAAPEQIAELVAAEVDRRDNERWERRRERMIERTDEATREFAAEHGLDEGTATQLATMATAEREQLFDVFRRARAGEVPFSEARTKADTIRTETDTNVEAILDDDAYSAYQERREEERGPWRRGRR